MSELHTTATLPNSNKLEVSGNLTADPVFDAASRRLVFRIANNRNYKDANGKWHKASSFFNVAMWGADAVKHADIAKGDGVVILGRLSSNSWTGKDGRRRYDVEIVAYKLTHYPKTARVAVSDDATVLDDAGEKIAAMIANPETLAGQSPLACALMAGAISGTQFEELAAIAKGGTLFSWDAEAKELVNSDTKIVIDHDSKLEIVAE